MNIKNIIKSIGVILGKFDLINAITSGQVDAFKNDIDILMHCVNVIINEIVSDYIPVFKVEEIDVVDGKYPIDSLSSKLLAIRNIKYKNGNNVKFSIENKHIVLPNGKFSIKYSYLPSSYTFDDEITELDSQITERVIVCGVVSEYYYLSGLYSEAELWRSKFEGGINSACKRLTNIIMRGRIWE